MPRKTRADAKPNRVSATKNHAKPSKVRLDNGQFATGVTGNPKGRPPKRRSRRDGWSNVVTNVGTANDPRSGARYNATPVPTSEARKLWRTNDIAARVIETHPGEALRRWITLTIGGPDGKEKSEAVLAALETIPGPSIIGNGAQASYLRVACYENGYGGGAIWPVFNDSAGGLEKPVVETGIHKIERLQVFEPRELRPVSYYQEIGHPKYGEPEVYRVIPLSGRTAQGSQQLIHESRLIIFPGIRVTREELQGVEFGWGDNKLTRCADVLADFDLSFAGAAALLARFSELILKLKGLADLVSTNEDSETRLQEMNKARSILNALVLDSEDSAERLTTSLTGYPETLDKLALRLSAAADMPVSLLLGQAPAGLNATGDSDIRFFYDRVAQLQTKLKPLIEKLVRWVMLTLFAGKEPETWSVDFPPLWQPTRKEDAEARKIQQEIDHGYIEDQVYSSEEVAKWRFGGDTYAYESTIDFNERAKLEKQAAQEIASLGGTGDIQKEAMNGAQIASLVAVITAVAAGEISRESGIGVIKLAFQVDEAQATELVGPDNFEPKAAAPAVNPFGGASDQKPAGSPVSDQKSATDTPIGKKTAPPAGDTPIGKIPKSSTDLPKPGTDAGVVEPKK